MFEFIVKFWDHSKLGYLKVKACQYQFFCFKDGLSGVIFFSNEVHLVDSNRVNFIVFGRQDYQTSRCQLGIFQKSLETFSDESVHDFDGQEQGVFFELVLGTGLDQEFDWTFSEFRMSLDNCPALFVRLILKFSLSVMDGSEDSWTLNVNNLCFHFLNSIKRFKI